MYYANRRTVLRGRRWRAADGRGWGIYCYMRLLEDWFDVFVAGLNSSSHQSMFLILGVLPLMGFNCWGSI